MPYALTDRLIESFFSILAAFILWIQPALPYLCAVIAWSLVTAIILSLVTTARRSLTNLRKIHQIPCSRCAFSTSDYRLKCSVRPIDAFSEAAINCYDFESTDTTQLAL
ncbi:MAG: hypothetical protein WA947_04260 [Phormidesmis sp.]